jgi:hypothetical protein
MNKIAKRRLEKVADLMENFPKENRLNMYVFALSVENGKPVCGTAACVAGWAATISSLRRAGYHLTNLGVPAYNLEGRLLLGFDAIRKFFDLTGNEAIDIFGAYDSQQHANLHSPKAAAKRIRKILAKYE